MSLNHLSLQMFNHILLISFQHSPCFTRARETDQGRRRQSHRRKTQLGNRGNGKTTRTAGAAERKVSYSTLTSKPGTEPLFPHPPPPKARLQRV